MCKRVDFVWVGKPMVWWLKQLPLWTNQKAHEAHPITMLEYSVDFQYHMFPTCIYSALTLKAEVFSCVGLSYWLNQDSAHHNIGMFPYHQRQIHNGWIWYEKHYRTATINLRQHLLLSNTSKTRTISTRSWTLVEKHPEARNNFWVNV
jgi:hypothetical protein